jgi:peptidyl-prolyl cis-trans isomerase A (cyclophilin A)
MQKVTLRGMPFLARFFTLCAGLTLSGAVLAADVSASSPQVSLQTSMGVIVLELNQEKAPKTVENFLQYVNNGHYKGTIFHRVIDGFMIQGGGFDKSMTQTPTKAPIKNEAQNGLRNLPYSIAMARTGDPHSATAQFFINVGNNGALDYPGSDGFGYTVFGRVIKGMDVVDKIKSVPVANAGPHQNVPVTAVVIESATLLKNAAADKKVK